MEMTYDSNLHPDENLHPDQLLFLDGDGAFLHRLFLFFGAKWPNLAGTTKMTPLAATGRRRRLGRHAKPFLPGRRKPLADTLS